MVRTKALVRKVMAEPFRCGRCGAYGLRASAGDCCAALSVGEAWQARQRAEAHIRAALPQLCRNETAS